MRKINRAELESIARERKLTRTSKFEKVPAIYTSDIKKILSGMEKYKIDPKEADKKRILVAELQENLEISLLSENYANEIFGCLKEISQDIERKELAHYRQKTLVDNFFARFKFLVFHPKLFETTMAIQSMTKNSIFIAEPVHKLSKNQLKEIHKFPEEDEETEKTIQNIIKETINNFSNNLLTNYSENIDASEKEEIIKNAQEKFPNVGNNKLLFFSRPNLVKSLDQDFQEYINNLLKEFFLDYISYNMDRYSVISNLFHDFFLGIHFVLIDGSIDEVYTGFSQRYIDGMFSKVQEGKIRKTETSKSDQLSNIKTINESIRHHMPKKSIKPEVLEGIDRLLSEIGTNKETENEIRRIFLKRFLKKKEVRLHDLQEKYGIQKELISESTIKILVNAGCNINTNGTKEKAKTEISPNKEEPINNAAEIITTNQDKIIEEVRNRADIHEIFEYYGYTILNPKRFEKQITSLYPSQKEKEILIDTLKSNIERPKKRNGLGYRAIDLKIGRRILILNKNEIDGIYTHEEYVNRTSVII